MNCYGIRHCVRACAGAAMVVLLGALLSGCAVLSPVVVPPPVAASSLTPSNQFSMSGRFSARNEREQVSGQFRYAETPRTRTLSLFSPLGTAIADIIADGSSVTLTLANGNTQTAGSVAELLRTVIDLPVTDKTLSAWLQGLPTTSAGSGANAIELGADGRPRRFVEAGWEVVVSERMVNAIGPKRMRWSVLGQPETEVRWVVDEWSAQ